MVGPKRYWWASPARGAILLQLGPLCSGGKRTDWALDSIGVGFLTYVGCLPFPLIWRRCRKATCQGSLPISWHPSAGRGKML